jgi:2,4-dienoyl-CoA reductase (NADPH2)
MRKAISLPVVGVGRFKDPRQADRALIDGHADLIGVVRGQIADPDFAAKARAGEAGTIRACLSCNQECVGRMGLNRWLGCIENPRTGKEGSLPAVQATPPRSVLVAGAGPAGLQTAIAAAQAGHRVSLHEKSSAAGGLLRLAATVPHRAELGELIRNQLGELARLGVAVRYDSCIDVAAVRREHPDVVVVATGSEPDRPWWAGDSDHVVDVIGVLNGEARPAGEVLVVDEIGFHHAPSVAELLADRGCQVEVITPAMVVGQDLGLTLDMESWYVRAGAKRIVQTTDVIVTAASPNPAGRLTVGLMQHTTGAIFTRTVDWLVLAVPPRPLDRLWHELQATGPQVYRVGDCVAPRRAHAAVIEGDRVGAWL